MNKVGKTAMIMMGAGMIMGASYYMGLPKEKKQSIKDKASKMISADKEFMSDLSM
ncbi:MAG: hypothetical protein IJL74_01910 [Bacilli bacterium]|nr:hypothetical protein [Bacilli bacterium]